MKKDELTFALIDEASCQWVRLSTQGWNELYPGVPGQNDQRERQRLASAVWQALPEPVQDVLLPDRANGRTILISGDATWSTFPWELLRFGDGAGDYLGLHHALPRVGSILAPRLRHQLAAEQLGTGDGGMALVAPHTTGRDPLQGVVDEVEAIRERVAADVLKLCETGDAAHDGVMRAAIRMAPDILYFSGHGTVISNEELLVLQTDRQAEPRPRSDITYFGAYHLDEMAKAVDGRLLPHAPLVVLNSCYTGRTRAFGGRREDLVQAFLRHGAGAVVSTSLPIYDLVGEALGRALFSEQATQCVDIGSLLVTARRELAFGHCRDLNRPQWGAWGMIHLHGNGGATQPLLHRAQRQ